MKQISRERLTPNGDFCRTMDQMISCMENVKVSKSMKNGGSVYVLEANGRKITVCFDAHTMYEKEAPKIRYKDNGFCIPVARNQIYEYQAINDQVKKALGLNRKVRR